MAKAAKKDSIYLTVDSGFRSIRYQKKIIAKYLGKGISFGSIMNSVAPPGYSEHMLGTALDFVPSDRSFDKTDSYKWLNENAWLFGFKQTYTNSINSLNEPWHWNYIPKKKKDENSKMLTVSR